MLVLSRKKNESIVINNDVIITVVEIRGDQVTGELRFEARWQRRVGRERWLVGVFTTACMLQDAGPTG